MKSLTWKQLLDLANNSNVTILKGSYQLTSLEIFWLPFKATYILSIVDDDTYSIKTINK